MKFTISKALLISNLLVLAVSNTTLAMNTSASAANVSSTATTSDVMDIDKTKEQKEIKETKSSNAFLLSLPESIKKQIQETRLEEAKVANQAAISLAHGIISENYVLVEYALETLHANPNKPIQIKSPIPDEDTSLLYPEKLPLIRRITDFFSQDLYSSAQNTVSKLTLNFTERDLDYMSAPFRLVLHFNKEIAELLFQNKANINTRDVEGMTLLGYARMLGIQKAIDWFVKYKFPENGQIASIVI